MPTSTVKLSPKSTAEAEIHIPWEEISSTYEKIIEKVAYEMELPGFRKGKAPRALVEKNIDKKKIYEEVIKEIIPKVYTEAVTSHHLKPVSSPKIELVKAKENEEWVVKVTLALKPKINLKNYKEKIKELKKAKVKIWTPGSLPGEREKKDKEERKKPTLEELIDVFLSEIEVELSDLIITQETNRLLSNLIEQTQKLGLTIEQYLLAKGKNSDQLREEYSKQAVRNLSLEFALAEIADQENITVTQADLDNLLSKVEKEEEREKLKKESYYLAHLIRQQKTLDFLFNL